MDIFKECVPLCFSNNMLIKIMHYKTTVEES